MHGTTLRLALAASLLLVAACGGEQAAGPGELTAIVVNSPGTLEVGEAQRVLVALADEGARLVAGPDPDATATFSAPDGTDREVPVEWVWAIEGVRGFFVATPDLDAAGAWQVSVRTADGESGPASFQVVEESPLPGVGDPAPASETRTHPPLPLEEITTDPEPDPGFYDLTVAEAVGGGRPTVVVFATPAFCQTAVCGPTLDVVKAVAPAHPDVEFVHVEVYEDLDPGGGELREVAAVREWGLQSEPWVFVVDGDGIVSARFEGTVGAEELERALAEAT